jgi:bifunctional UDP-N-acetylglucosamine pyrophosphorylase / glucosamine-1-phosphate N-acetyltransferase
MTVSIVMAGGKGKRFGNIGVNKTAELFLGKPLVRYGTDLFTKTTDKVIVVVGVEPESVKKAIGDNDKVVYALQKKPLGTGDALRVAMEKIISMGWDPEIVFIGNGDHMMFYDEEIINEMKKKLISEMVDMVMLTTDYADPDKLAWGRVIRNNNGLVERIVEQKDASLSERKITEQNVNFFAYTYDFVSKNYNKIKPSPVSGEYYITDMVELAVNDGRKVVAIKVPFEKVGIGINTKEELEMSMQLYKKLKSDQKE